MALSSVTEHWIRKDALTITLNVLGPDIIQASVLAGTSIAAYKNGVIGYDAGHNFRTWPIAAYATALEYSGPNYVYAKLTRNEKNAQALIAYTRDVRDIEGRITLEDGSESEADADYFYIYLGKISASVDEDGNTVDRYWIDSFRYGTLGTDQFKMEAADAEWKQMFRLNKVSDVIEVLKNIASATIGKLKVLTEFVLGGKSVTGVAISSDEEKIELPQDTDLTTAGYVKAYADAKTVSKVNDDVVQGNITFLQDINVQGGASVQGDLSVDGGVSVAQSVEIDQNVDVSGEAKIAEKLTVGNFIEEGDIIQGAQITKDGIGSFAGLKSPFMQIYELIFNRKTAVQGEFSFSDGDTVEGVTLNGDGTYTLTLREQYEGYVTSFKFNDIVYANVNLIGNSGDTALTGKCWMRVNHVADDGLSLNVTLYSDAQVPSGANISPKPYMIITRHGNETDESRQSVWIVSSEDGRMFQLTGVDSPIINSESCYATVIGVLPQNLIDYIQASGYYDINPTQPYFYGRGMIVQDLVQIDYRGKVVQTERYRGAWSLSVAQGADPYMNTGTIYDTVSHNGSKWACQASKTTVEPSVNVSEWVIVVSKGDDAELSMYMIVPSVNVVYVREGNVMSATSLDVTVHETSQSGVLNLTTQSELDKIGLTVQYAVDGEGEHKVLNIGGDSSAIELEDGSGVIVNESDDETGNAIIMLEGESIDVSDIKDNVTLYLVDENGIELHRLIIPVIKDGLRGEKGEQGEKGQSSFKSFVFLRSDSQPDTPIGGDYSTPLPNPANGWSDGTPSGTERLWMSTRVFTSDGLVPQQDVWTTPVSIADTADFDVEFSSEENPDDPTGHPNTNTQWNNTADESTIWMATSRKSSGVWDDWKVVKIKGEKGEQGEKGENGVMYEVKPMPSILSVVTDAETGLTIKQDSFIVECSYFADNVEIAVSSSEVVTSNFGNLSVGNLTSDGRARVAVFIPQGIIPSVGYITVIIAPDGYPSVSADIAIAYPQRGLVGPAGQTGPLLYPVGVWEDIIYTQTRDGDGNVIATPFVYYDSQNTGNGQYYVLQKDLPNTGLPITDTSYWKPFSKIQYVFTEALMANWARLAKAVFWGNYMFSAKGQLSDGTQADYSSVAESMFSNGVLNGKFVPNLFFDMENGLIKTNRLSETFRPFREYYESYSYGVLEQAPAIADMMDYNSSYNIITAGETLQMLLMPLMRDIVATRYRAHAFIRSNSEPSIPTDGSYSNPIPSGWYGYIPDKLVNGVETGLWMATRLFTEDGIEQEDSWTLTEFPLAEDTTQIRYSAYDFPVFDPLNGDGWGRENYAEAVWIAYRRYNGGWGDWFYANIRDRQILTKASYEPDGVNSLVMVNPSIDYERKIATSFRSYPADGVSDGYGYTWKNMFGRSLIVCADPRFFDKHAYKGFTGYPTGVFAPNGEIEYTPSDKGDDFGYMNANMLPEHFFVVDGVFSKFIFLEPGSKIRMKSCTINYTSTTGESRPVHVWVVENSSDLAQIPAEIHIYTEYKYTEGDGTYTHEQVEYIRYGVVGNGNDSIDGNNVYRGRIFGTKRMAQFYELHAEKRGVEPPPATIKITMSDYLHNKYVDDIYWIYNETKDL